MSQENKAYLKHALISILVGAVVAAVSTILQGVLNLVKIHGVDLLGTGASMVYYLKARKIA